MRIKREWAKGEARKLWHPHFAWWWTALPGYWVWLEWIERRGTLNIRGDRRWWTWEYRDHKSRRV